MKKVTARQLMIGDWVRYGGVIRKTTRINEHTIILSTDNVNSMLVTKFATPIPITEEWLNGNGWVQSPLTNRIMYGKTITKNCTMFYTMSDKSIIVTLFKENTSEYERQSTLIGCLYIHQLQQAYRLATGGEELKVKF